MATAALHYREFTGVYATLGNLLYIEQRQIDAPTVVVKQITGGDTLTARFLHKEFFEFKPQFKIWLGTNYKPTIYGTDEGIWRRIRLIPFNVYIPDGKKDEKLPQKLKSEAPGILNWALQGLQDYRMDGLLEPVIVNGATEDYRTSQDGMNRFLEECTEESVDADTPARQLYDRYASWCIATGEYKLKKQKFAEGMQIRGKKSKRKRQNSGRTIAVYEGMKLRRPSYDLTFEASAMLYTPGARDDAADKMQIIQDLKTMAMTMNDGEGVSILTPIQGNRAGFGEAGINEGRWELNGIYKYSEIEKSLDNCFYIWFNDAMAKMDEPKVMMGTCKSRDASLLGPTEVPVDPYSLLVGSSRSEKTSSQKATTTDVSIPSPTSGGVLGDTTRHHMKEGEED